MSAPFKDRLFRGYGPLIGFTAVFLAVVLLVPSTAPETEGVKGGDSESVLDQLGEEAGADELTDDTVQTDSAPVDAGPTGDSDPTGGSGGGQSGGGGGGGGSAPGAQGQQSFGAGGPGVNDSYNPALPVKVEGCGTHQVAGDPYAPPCVQFQGSNGGATSKGVTEREIKVAVRVDGFTEGLGDALSNVASGNIPKETPDKILNTLKTLGEYFNKKFQFYGRKLNLVMFDGKGNPLYEILDKGQEGAQADALKVSKEIGAFADVSAVTPAYADALAKQQVINTGAPFVSKRWMNERKPFSWSQFTDCQTVVESVGAYYNTKMGGGKAVAARGALANQQRRTAMISPSNAQYQECVQAGKEIVRKGGHIDDLALELQYQLRIESSGDAKTALAKMKAANITTLVCGCDPIFLNFLTGNMAKEQYYPEMVMTGLALLDMDLVGQILNQTVWRRAFGVSFAGPTQPQNASLGYRAYKSIRGDEPSLAVDLMYNQLYLLAIGIQMAGPKLTPASFEKGMFDYPSRSGPYGTWGFGPNDYTTSDDAKEVHWNPDAVSVATRSKGAWIDSNGGKRFPIGQWPSGQPRFTA